MTKIAQHAIQEMKKTPQLQLCIVPYCQKVESFSRCNSFVFINLLMYLNFGGIYFVFNLGFLKFFLGFCVAVFFQTAIHPKPSDFVQQLSHVQLF